MNATARPVTIFRNTLTNGIVVSTICYREGRGLVYETALIVNGVTSDGVRCGRKSMASVIHDRVAGIAMGCRFDAFDSRHEQVIKMYADAAGY